MNAASGWNDLHWGVGDMADVHNYEKRPFGGLDQTFRRWQNLFPSGARARVPEAAGLRALGRGGHSSVRTHGFRSM